MVARRLRTWPTRRCATFATPWASITPRGTADERRCTRMGNDAVGAGAMGGRRAGGDPRSFRALELRLHRPARAPRPADSRVHLPRQEVRLGLPDPLPHVRREA